MSSLFLMQVIGLAVVTVLCFTSNASVTIFSEVPVRILFLDAIFSLSFIFFGLGCF